ncbi:inhibitor of Bruton tyrosine kinase isoform X2 [Leptinotarsa decemlineata]|uniref:inhibitor of Bruton tyrosine kinase isoform X2 n=1 Tax=Leptinotarsa decemlineata TaxID=7539 RepID=UPI003D304470
MSIPENRPDCSYQCRSKQHGDIITAAISKRSVSNTDLCSFLNFVCCRCESVVDSAGRTALHVAASCGRVELVRWLVTSRHADINAKDRESGYTALHRSVFYGKIHVAVELVKLGASTAELDSDSLTALEHSMKDGLKPELSREGELYSWGSNTNNLLGPQQAKQTPELLDIFHKEYPGEYVQSICISQFHTVIITSSGKALSCGHGQGGRLGLGDEKAVVSPHTISFSRSQKGDTVTCLQASIARDHSIFLCSDDNIYTCGLNTYNVLGQSPPPERALFPKPIKHISKQIQGVCAARYHSVAWGPDGLYTWGLNAGQLGHTLNAKSRDRFVVSPRIVSVTNDFGIKMVEASTGATAVCTQKGDIYVLHEYLCRKVASRQLNVVQISIVGGKLDSTQLDSELSKEHSKELKVGVLTNTGNILLWQESDQQLCRCIYNINRAIVVKQISLNLNELLFVSDFGEAFKGIVRARRKNTTSSSSKNSQDKSAFHKFLDRDECVKVSLEKVAKIHRAVAIQSDLKGKDYCVIQALPYRSISFPEIARSHMKSDLEALIADVDETDNIHDVVFKVDNCYFPAHKYILSNNSSYLEKLMDENNKTIVLNDVNPDVFEQFLLYVYKGECELTKCGELKNERLRRLCPVKEEKPDEVSEIENVPANISAYEYYNKKKTDDKGTKLKNKSSRNPVRLLHELAKRFECLVLQKTLARLDMDKYLIRLKQDGCAVRENFPTFNRLNFPNLYDVLVKCRDNKEIKAHKCILSARMEYFANMFSLRWGGEQTTEVSLPFPKSTVEALLEFLYTDSLSTLSSIDTDHLFKILILADQLFVTRLKDQCERLLSDNLTLRNVIQILAFAHVYNAEKLKVCCMKFMVLNMTPLLESRALDELEEELLKELSEFYFQEKREVWCRVITPYSTAVLDEVVLTVGVNYPVSMTDEKTRSHKVSEKNLSVSFDNDVPLDSIIQFPDEPEALPKNNSLPDLPSRLKSINQASEIVKSETIEIQYTKLGSDRSRNSMELSFSFTESSSFPDLNSPPLHSNSSFQAKSPTQKGAFKHKMVKISQKERKRLSSGSNNDTSNDSASITVTPKNPWKTIPDASSPATSTELKHIGDIISDEKKQKENLVKLTTKSLVCTQLEDKAIDDLHKFYNTENLEDEIIVIERVNIGAIARPVWVPRTK